MKRVHSISMLAGISTLAVGLLVAPEAYAEGPNDYGCHGDDIRCTGNNGFSGTCAYNAGRNACTCAGTYPLIGGTWEYNDGECMLPRIE